MPIQTGFWWNPFALNAAIKSAFRPSVYTAIADAKKNAHPSQAAGATGKVTSDTTAYMKPTGLGFVFERGRAGGYEINPATALGLRRGKSKGETVFRVKTGTGDSEYIGFGSSLGLKLGARRGPIIGGPMEPDPYVKPAADRWAAFGYKTMLQRWLASAGFGVKL